MPMTKGPHQVVSDTDLTIERYGGTVIVRPSGPKLAERELLIIRPKVAEVLTGSGASVGLLVLDMSQVLMVSSMGLGLCIDLRNDAAVLGAKTAVFGANEQLEALFRMVRAHRLFRMIDSRTDLQRMLVA